MFHPETVTKPLTKKEIRKLNFDATEDCWFLILSRLFMDEVMREALPDEYKRLSKESNRITKHLTAIFDRHSKCMLKWFWPVRNDPTATRDDKLLALSKCMMAFSYEMKRYNDVLGKHFENVIKYCEENKIDLNQYKDKPYWRNWKEKD